MARTCTWGGRCERGKLSVPRFAPHRQGGQPGPRGALKGAQQAGCKGQSVERPPGAAGLRRSPAGLRLGSRGQTRGRTGAGDGQPVKGPQPRENGRSVAHRHLTPERRGTTAGKRGRGRAAVGESSAPVISGPKVLGSRKATISSGRR